MQFGHSHRVPFRSVGGYYCDYNWWRPTASPTDRNVFFIFTKSRWGKHEAHVSRAAAQLFHVVSPVIIVRVWRLDMTVVGLGAVLGHSATPDTDMLSVARRTCKAHTPGGHRYLHMASDWRFCASVRVVHASACFVRE